MIDEVLIESVIARLPRHRPVTALVQSTLPNSEIQHMPSFEEHGPGDRADALAGNGRKALYSACFGPSALQLMKICDMGEAEVLTQIVGNMSLRMAHHLNHTPEQLQLTVVAAKPANSGKRADQIGIYKGHQKSYLGWVGDVLLDMADSKTVAVALLPGNAPPSTGKVADVMVMGRDGLERMQKGLCVPAGWSVEHIEARGLDIGARREEINDNKNRLDNLIVMPKAVNWWTAELESLQMEPVFPKGKLTKSPEFMICARPWKGPDKGFFVYGAQKPAEIPSDTLQGLRECQISDLPEVDEVLARPVAASSRTPRWA